MFPPALFIKREGALPFILSEKPLKSKENRQKSMAKSPRNGKGRKISKKI